MTNPPLRKPRTQRREWRGFVHLLARFFMDYRAAIVLASTRKRGRAVDIDCRVSKEGSLWALHWPTVGKNKLHDPDGLIPAKARICDLSNEEIKRLRSKSGKSPERLRVLLNLACLKGVRVEVELKDVVDEVKIDRLLARTLVDRMNVHGGLQFKTLAGIGDPIARLAPVHNAGGTTILSFTRYRGKGIDKSKAWPVTDYVRGRAKWR